MEIVTELIKVLMIPVVVLLIPLFFIIIFDIAAHLSDLFGGGRDSDRA